MRGGGGVAVKEPSYHANSLEGYYLRGLNPGCALEQDT